MSRVVQQSKIQIYQIHNETAASESVGKEKPVHLSLLVSGLDKRVSCSRKGIQLNKDDVHYPLICRIHFKILAWFIKCPKEMWNLRLNQINFSQYIIANVFICVGSWWFFVYARLCRHMFDTAYHVSSRFTANCKANLISMELTWLN